MALEFLVSNGDPTGGSLLLSRPKCFMATVGGRGADRDLIKDEPGEMVLPAVEKPLAFSKAVLKDNPAIKFNKGTTTLAFKFKHGVIVATDSRATAGPYIASQTVKKVIKINKYLLGTMAGGAADCQYWERVLSQQCRLYELRNGHRISTAAASKILCNIIYQYKGYGLSMGTMIAGWDLSGPGLYYVDDDGTRLCHPIFSCGSGSPFAYGVLDAGYKWDLTVPEAYELASNAIYVAGFRDSMSGGYLNLWHMKETGCEQIAWKDQREIHYEKEAKESSA